MNAKITFRHNVMAVQTLDTFANIRGGFSFGRKDVYFVRAVGECPDFIRTFEDLESRLAGADKSNRIRYIRLDNLPSAVEAQALDFYISAYSAWKQGKTVETRIHSVSSSFGGVLENATRKAVEEYRTVSQSISESMIRNFVIKLWYWTDLFLGDVVKEWSENRSVKIVSHNIVKPQEYLFCYFATMLGCDVLIFNNRSDISISENVSRLSSEIILGKFGTVNLSEHGSAAGTRNDDTECSRSNDVQTGVKNDPEKHGEGSAEMSPKKAELSSPGKIGDGNRHHVKSNPQPAESVSDTAGNDAGDTAGRIKQEKNFEELAQLASSIVMIAIHDKNGDPAGSGSGIMIGKNGYILTTCHVIEGGFVFAVRIENEEKVYFTSEVVKYNALLDLAVIRIDRELTPLTVYDGRTKLVRGQRVISIGSPLGLFNSVSDGIISGFRRIRDVNMIQFTAPTSPGSSGGAVLNMYGEVIGISTAGFDGGQNINLAVDYNDIRLFAKGFF